MTTNVTDPRERPSPTPSVRLVASNPTNQPTLSNISRASHFNYSNGPSANGMDRREYLLPVLSPKSCDPPLWNYCLRISYVVAVKLLNTLFTLACSQMCRLRQQKRLFKCMTSICSKNDRFMDEVHECPAAMKGKSDAMPCQDGTQRSAMGMRYDVCSAKVNTTR